MQKKQETIADIIAEMRGARTEFPFVYLMGEPDTPEVIDLRTKKIIEPRKINIRRVTVKELADRFEAALKRECGDCAKLRDALQKAAESAAEIMERVRHKDGLAFNTANYIAGVARTALAAPPRNHRSKKMTVEWYRSAKHLYTTALRYAKANYACMEKQSYETSDEVVRSFRLLHEALTRLNNGVDPLAEGGAK